MPRTLPMPPTPTRRQGSSPVETALSVDHLTKSFGGRKAVDNVSFALPEGAFLSVFGPNGAGKTTLLRDMICALSDGSETRPACRVGVVDERGELAAMYRGVPQLEIGAHTDVLDGCPKALGVVMLLRAANPQIIAVDEITAEADARALLRAANCGVRLLATAHGTSAADLRRRSVYRPLAESGVFQTLLILRQDKSFRAERAAL